MRIRFYAGILFFLTVFFYSSQTIKAQRVGIGTQTPNTSAILDVQSTNNGFLPPRMTMTQRNAINNPAPGLMIYCSDCVSNGTGEMNYYNGHVWTSMNMANTNSNTTSLPNTSIGTQVWNSKNLDVVRYRNGDTIPQVTDSAQWSNLTSGAWCWYNNDSATYAAKYGRLYNWYAVNDPRGIAPVGWHVPTKSEFNTLIKQLDSGADTLSTNTLSNTAGSALKNTTGWTNLPDSVCPTCVNGDNSSGFSAIPGGYRSSSFSAESSLGIYWLATKYDSSRAHYILLYGTNNQVFSGYISKKTGFSLRVLRDQLASGPFFPTVNTTSVTNITDTTASTGGVILSDGGLPITAKGVCWSTNSSPDISLMTKTTDGIGITSFSSNLQNLAGCTKYYVRAYAINALGVAYGESLSFRTMENASDYNNLNLNDLLGAYNNTNENFGGSFYGPYTTTISSINQISATTGTITVENIYDYGWAPITFLLDWTDPNNRTVVASPSPQYNIAPSSTVSSAYPSWNVMVAESTEGPGTFYFCQQKLVLKLRVGIRDPQPPNASVYSSTPYTITMER